MSKSASTARRFTDKPTKPNPDFPLFPHATKRWAKKIRGKLNYFGPWDDPDGALKKYLKEKDHLHAGRKPREEVSAGVTVKALCNAYLIHKQSLLDSGEIAPRTWGNCKQATDLLVANFTKHRLVSDLRPDDFAKLRKQMSKTWGLVRVRDFIQRVRNVFNYGMESGLITVPILFGAGFKPPSAKSLRLERAERGKKMFEAAEIRLMLEGKTVQGKGGPRLVKPSVQLKAMILLGANCGFGNADCGTLPIDALDLEGGWVNYHRPKTGVTRRNALWPETVAALKEALAGRTEPNKPEHAGRVFITSVGESWHKAGAEDNPISKEMRKLLNALGIGGNRGFYCLRHVLETIGGQVKDQVGVDAVMGHMRNDMASRYREGIEDERLKAVSDHVRKWVIGDRTVS